MAEWKRKMMVKGGGKMELWSRYFHQMLALQDSTLKSGQVKVKSESEKMKVKSGRGTPDARPDHSTLKSTRHCGDLER